MSNANEFNQLLMSANWAAVDLAAALGDAAWPEIDLGIEHTNPDVRQIATVCAGEIGGANAGRVLLAALHDKVINVRIAAASALSVNPPKSVTSSLLRELNSPTNDIEILELLALAAGHLPGAQTLRVLEEMETNDSALATAIELALAKLGKPDAMQAVADRLLSSDAYVRYMTLQNVMYIDRAEYVVRTRSLLNDREVALLAGHERRRKERRVCDQAVEALAKLLQVQPAFLVSEGLIYSDEQLAAAAAW